MLDQGACMQLRKKILVGPGAHGIATIPCMHPHAGHKVGPTNNDPGSLEMESGRRYAAVCRASQRASAKE